MSATEILTWDRALMEFELYQRSRGHSVRTIGNYKAMLLRLVKHASCNPAEISLTDLRGCLNTAPSAAYKQNLRACYQVFFRWAYRDGLIPANHAERLDPVRVPRRLPRPLTSEQVQLMLDTTTHRKTRTMILLGALQGLRVSEIARFRGEMVDLVDNRVRFLGKGDVPRDDELHELVRAEAWAYPRKGFWFPSQELVRQGNNTGHVHGKSVSARLSTAIARAGIKVDRIDGVRMNRLTGHSLRHHFGTELLEAGVDIRTIQSMMGHASLQTTALYTQVSRTATADAISKLPTFELPEPRRHRTSAEARPQAAARRRAAAEGAVMR